MNSKTAQPMLLAPLSEATEQLLEPPQLRDDDYLFLWMDPEGTRFIAELRSCKEDEEGILRANELRSPSWAAEEFFRRIPEKKHLGKKDPSKRFRWRISATDFTALVIHHCWPGDRIRFQARLDLEIDVQAQVMYQFLLTRFTAQTIRAEMQAKFKVTGEKPQTPNDWRVHNELPLSDYQVAACLFTLGQDASALFMDRGTGKTATSIHRISMEATRYRERTGKMFLALIVVPMQVMQNWQDEIKRFTCARGKVVVVRGGPIDRVKCLVHGIKQDDDLDFGAVVIGYESLAASIDAFASVPWNLTIADESQRFKASYTNRWKIMQRIRDASDARMVLTGTPIGNSPMDLWTQLEFLGEGLSGFQTFKGFRSFYGVWEEVKNAPGIQRLLGMKNVALLQERLARLTFSITKEEAGLNLPDKTYDTLSVEMTESQTKYYNQACEQLAVEIKDMDGDVTDAMTVDHILVMLLRLAQITSGIITWDAAVDPDTGEEVRAKRVQQINAKNPKIEAVMDQIIEELEEDPRGKKIIWASEVESLRAIGARLTELGIRHGVYFGGTSHKDRDEMVRAFNNDEDFKVLVANQQTAGEGLNLVGHNVDVPDMDTFCDHEFFFSQGWSSILRAQAEDRAHRRGTKMPVRITDVTVIGTIDEEIRERVRGKREMASMTLQINDILKSILGDLYHG